ncbi:hypothetical protein SRHO_G00222190 [Serrasalmus rhombeus]
MDSRPVFHIEENRELTLRASPAALAVEREHLSHIGSGTPFRIQDPVAVRTGAKQRVVAAGGTNSCYIQWLRGQASRPGTKMEALKKYIQKRDVDQAVHGSSPSSSSLLAPGSLLCPGPSREQSPKAGKF